MNKKKLPKAIRNTAEEIRAAQAEPVVPAPAPAAAMKPPPFLQASPAISTSSAPALAAAQGMAPSPASVNHTAVEPITTPSPLTGVIIHPDTRPGAERASPDWERRLLRAQSIIERHATYSALGGIIPLPIVNVGAVTTVILRMVKALTELYGVPFERDRARAVVLGLMGGTMPTGLAAVTTSTLTYIVPGSNLVGLAVSSIAAGACARSIGRMFVERLEDGIDPQQLQPAA